MVAAKMSTSTEADTGNKRIAAVHSNCRSWVISGQTRQGLNPTAVRYGPKADKNWQN